MFAYAFSDFEREDGVGSLYLVLSIIIIITIISVLYCP